MGHVRQIRAGLSAEMIAKFIGHSDGGKMIRKIYIAEFDSHEAQYEKKIIESLKG
jgi:hypothetical protein